MADLNIDVGTRPNELGINLGVGTVMGVYTAGEGIWIEDHVINADVTQPELDALAASIPTAKVERVTDGALVTVTDSSGTTTAMLHDATIADGSVTTKKLADNAVTADKLADNSVYGGSIANDVIEERHLSTTLVDKLAFATDVDREVKKISIIAADAATSQALAALGFDTLVMTPKDMGGTYTWPYLRLCWISSTTMEVAPIRFYGNLQTRAVTLYAKGYKSTASGILGVDTNWTITALPTDADGVSY